MGLAARGLPQAALTGGSIGWAMAWVLLFAVLARALGYTGYFGSDEVTYTEQAFKLLDRDWTVSEYVGANRLGVNFPVAFFALLFGRNEFGGAIYSLLSSVVEVGLVTWVAYRMFGKATAVFAGLLLASLPTHIHFAGRLMADAPLCLTVTAAFVLFFEGEVRRSSVAYFSAGLFIGLSFWIKPPVTVFVAAVFLTYPLAVRRLDLRWSWVFAGAAIGVALNCLAFWLMTGNFWYIIEVTRARQASGYLEAGVAAGDMTTNADYYLWYLFGRIYHTGLLGYLALLGLVLAWRARDSLSAPVGFGLQYASLWALGLVVILSLSPVSLNPVILVFKQTNYILIFVAPLCLLAGWGLSRLPIRWATVIAAVCVSAGLVFAALLQGSIALFTANSWATLQYVQAKPGVTFYVMSNALRAARFQKLTQGADLEPRLRPIKELILPRPGSVQPAAAAPGEVFAVVDEQSFSWDGSRPFARPGDVPVCWVEIDRLHGSPEGLGVALLRTLVAVPGLSGSSIGARLQQLASPLPARVYRLPAAGC